MRSIFISHYERIVISNAVFILKGFIPTRQIGRNLLRRWISRHTAPLGLLSSK